MRAKTSSSSNVKTSDGETRNSGGSRHQLGTGSDALESNPGVVCGYFELRASRQSCSFAVRIPLLYHSRYCRYPVRLKPDTTNVRLKPDAANVRTLRAEVRLQKPAGV